jgi:hypothetical protein
MVTLIGQAAMVRSTRSSSDRNADGKAVIMMTTSYEVQRDVARARDVDRADTWLANMKRAKTVQ